MKKRLQGLIEGVLVGVILPCGVAFAKQISQTAELFYNNIKIYIDGGEIVPKDVNGNKVEPFIMNGTTYLPVRAISNALGKDVEWDGATQSVYIGKKDQTKPDNYLDKIQYTDFKSYDGRQFYKINGTVTDYMNTTYTNGILLYDSFTYVIENDRDEAHILIDYPLNSQYKKLLGKIVLPQKVDIAGFKEENINEWSGAVNVMFFGDGKLLYEATNISKTMPFSIDIDLSGVNKLTIKTSGKDVFETYIALTDLALYK